MQRDAWRGQLGPLVLGARVSSGACLLALSAVACTSSFDDARQRTRHGAARPGVIPYRSQPGPDGLLDGGCNTRACGDPDAQRFVVIGDYGLSGPAEAKVAALAARLEPDFIITTGDNNYPYGEATTIDENIGRYYHAFIAPYAGGFGAGANENRFFPSMGNHDWYTADGKPYLDYFSLPGNERYYDLVIGSVQLFAIDSDPLRELDGVTADSVQARWLETALASSSAAWKVVYFHHPPYSSSLWHGSSLNMRWPFAAWGASIVYSGHDHTYERFEAEGLPYIVNGVGGNELYELGTPLPESVARYNDSHGLVFVTVTPHELVSRFLDYRGQELDVLRLVKD